MIIREIPWRILLLRGVQNTKRVVKLFDHYRSIWARVWYQALESANDFVRMSTVTLGLEPVFRRLSEKNECVTAQIMRYFTFDYVKLVSRLAYLGTT